MSKFIHLHTHSHYSLLDGLAKIDDLIARAKELNMNSLAITDHGNLYGAVEFYKKATKAGIKPILGVEAYVAPGDHRDRTNSGGDKYYHLILLAKNKIGWLNLIQLVTKSNLEGFYYKPRIDKDLLRQHHDGLIALSGCLSGEVSRALMHKDFNEAKKIALEYRDIFQPGNFFIEIGHHPGIKETVKVGADLIKLARETGIPLVGTQDIHYVKSEDAEYHDILLAVQTGNKLSDGDRLTLKDDDFSMCSTEKMVEAFKDVPEAVENTNKIAELCNLELELNKIVLPQFPLPDGEKSAMGYLRKLVAEKIHQRFTEIIPEIQERLDYELGVIDKMGFPDYFLIVQDFINWSKERGIVVGPGRGSAAGSLVSYILGITDVDPLKYGLLFERFLNPDRIQFPDIDVDITDKRRDEVFGYLVEKYGQDRVAHIITFGTMAARAAIRDVGRALGISYGFCDQLAKLIPFNADIAAAMEIAEVADLYKNNADAKRILDGAQHLEGVARHASVHACGTVIANGPLTNHLPLQRAPQDENMIITQFEMHSVEDLGLLKMDLLGLKNLTIIEDTINLVRDYHGENIELSKINPSDPKTFELLRVADTIGVFQFESNGMRRYMKDIKPTEFEDLVALVALFRPGPMDLIPTYIRRKHGQEQISYLHPKLEPILKTTYGVGVYQEQMMRIARDLAGFSLAEADTLRKAIGKKIKSLLDQQKEKLIRGMTQNNIDEKTATAIWELFPPFARYGFNRSHAVCYAMIGYQTAYLKAHYPVEFMTSLLNADRGDTDRIAFVIDECKKHGIEVLGPDINHSSAAFMPEQNNIRFGLAAIKNVGDNIVEAIIDERQKGGEFQDLVDLLNRVQHKDLNKKSLESLIKSGALDSLGVERNEALSNIDDIIKFGSLVRKENKNSQMGLFGEADLKQSLRLKPAPPASLNDKLTWERELLGLYVSDHPLNVYRDKIKQSGARAIDDLNITPAAMANKQLIAGIISRVQRIVTKTGKPMLFAKIEDLTNALEVVVFPETLARNNDVWQENKLVLISGKLSQRDSDVKLICDKVEELV
ncbi:MAG: DNA polymerase III subunit alpha [bacterium]|nr:DNA polymerase III subunit alpha [bacterium]